MQGVSLAQAQTLHGDEAFAAYACLDSTGTREIYDVLRPRLNECQERTYKWNLAQLSPAIAMTLRGCRVDIYALEAAKVELKKDLVNAEKLVGTLPLVVERWDGTEIEAGRCPTRGAGPSGRTLPHKWPRRVKGEMPMPDTPDKKCEACGAPRVKPKGFEASSPQQCAHLFYDILKVDRKYGKQGQLTTDDDALARIKEQGNSWTVTKDGKPIKRPLAGLVELCDAILATRDVEKQLQFLSSKLSTRGRFHASFNVAAAWTGRWSSSKDPFQRGGNFQNIGEQHRHIFVPDPGRKIGYADLKTAESLKVAYLSGEDAYIEAHQGDVHTWVCRELWPGLKWTGDIKMDKKIAANSYPPWDDVPGHDYRFQSKRIQHGTNFGLSPYGIAIIARIPLEHAKLAQLRYFKAFPRIRDYQYWVAERVRGQFPLYNALMREVRLFGRPWDDHTRKQGLAFAPQGGVGDVLNTGLWRVWNECDPSQIELLAQVHDAILFQVPTSKVEQGVARLRELMTIPVPVTDFTGQRRTCTIPVEIAVGDNWGKWNDNPAKGRVNLSGIREVA